jgi:hypothetical protein
MKIDDCFPFSERYRYPEFKPGRIQMKTGVYSDTKLNYDFLSAEVQYIRGKDTLLIANKKDLRFVSVAQDTFYCYKGAYFEQLSGGSVKLLLKQSFKLKETQKQDSYGTTSAGAATNTYGSLPSEGNFYKLTANTDMVFQRTREYYITDPEGGFEYCTKKNILHLWPAHEAELKSYLKSNKVNFSSPDDLIKLTGFITTLK